MEKQNINENYYNFITRNVNFKWIDHNVDTEAKQRQYCQILEELVDISRKNVECLTEEQTDFVRRYIGVYGDKKSIHDIVNDSDKSYAQVSKIIDDSLLILRRRILRGFANLKETVLSGKITKEELLDTELELVYEDLGIRIANSMSRRGYKTFRDIVEKSIKELARSRGLGEKGLQDLVDYIHSLGLKFKNEDPFFTKKIANESQETKEPTNTLQTLAQKLAEVNSLKLECDQIISAQEKKKQELEILKQEILEAMNELSSDSNVKVNTIGIK